MTRPDPAVHPLAAIFGAMAHAFEQEMDARDRDRGNLDRLRSGPRVAGDQGEDADDEHEDHATSPPPHP